MLRRAHIIQACLLAVPPLYWIQAQDSLELPARNLGPSIVTVTAYDKTGKEISRGKGFFVTESGRVLTIRSLVVTDGARVEARTFDGKTYKVTGIVNENKEADLAIITVDLSKRKSTPLKVGGAIPAVGEKAVVIGSTTDRIIESTVSDIQDGPTGKIVQLTGHVTPGSTGSPVVNLNGEVFGVVNFQTERDSGFSAYAGSSLISLASSVERPKLLNNPRPQYTNVAQRMGLEGDVILRVLVGTDGLVKRAVLIRGLPMGLNDEALKAAYKMKFRPALKDGQPVNYWYPVIIEFRLK